MSYNVYYPRLVGFRGSVTRPIPVFSLARTWNATADDIISFWVKPFDDKINSEVQYTCVAIGYQNVLDNIPWEHFARDNNYTLLVVHVEDTSIASFIRVGLHYPDNYTLRKSVNQETGREMLPVCDDCERPADVCECNEESSDDDEVADDYPTQEQSHTPRSTVEEMEELLNSL